MPSLVHKRKPRTTIAQPYKPRKPKPPKDAPRTSAIVKPKHARSNLTLNDWLMVVAYFDTHQPISQDAVVAHFANLDEGALIFTQATLSRHLSTKGREADLAKVQSHPRALDSKRVRSVTRPDVEQCLVLFVKHWEDFRGRPVSGPMLIAKRQFFEERLNVPENERMKSSGWVQGFCKTYVESKTLCIQFDDNM